MIIKKTLPIACTLLVFTLSSCNAFAPTTPSSPTLSTVPESSTVASGSSTAASTAPLQPALPASTGTPAGIPNTSGSTAPLAPQYYYPLQNANYVSKDATIIVRFGPVLTSQQAASIQFAVKGGQSGTHQGQVILADDHQTVIFKPDQPFIAGEQVSYTIDSFQAKQGTAFKPISVNFTVAINMQVGSAASSSQTTLPKPPQSAFPNDLTLPQDIPHYTVSKPSPNTGEGYIFVAPNYWQSSTVGSYLLILDTQGQIVYYQSMANDLEAFDFKPLPNGLLSYYDAKNSSIVWMNSQYQTVNTFTGGTGYVPDLHDSLLLPNGNLIIMVNDVEQVDMSKIVYQGKPNASVYGQVLLELDPSKNVVWVWRSWDHFSFFDSTVDLTAQGIDLIHGNGLALSTDGNILLSSRNLSEITKINLQTGDVVWRLGGKANQFKFVNDQGFAFQHNVSQLPMGDILLFDDHGTDQNPTASRAVEYKIDEANKTVTRVWEYTHTPPVFTDFMGSAQSLPDGNTLIGWGDDVNTPDYTLSSIQEVTPAGQTVFELTFDQPYVSYRAFIGPWQGSPLTKPALAYKQDANSLTLGYSWNGATEVASWQIYGGNSAQSLSLIDQQAKNGFETQSHLTNLSSGECYFQAAALNQSGAELARSVVISTDLTTCPVG